MTEKKIWKPDVGTSIPVHLPQEIIRAEVLSYEDDDTMVAKLNVQPPMGKSHSYRFRQTITLHRAKAAPAGERWETSDAYAA